METELRERIVQLNTDMEDLRNDVESFCADLSIDLDTRWNLFKDSELGHHVSETIDFSDFGIDLYRNCNRHSTVNLVYEIDEIEAWAINYGTQKKEDLLNHMQEFHGIYTIETANLMKERTLDMFAKSCTMDW